MQQGTEIDSDMRHCHFLNLTCDMGINKRQRHPTLPFFLKSTGDMGTPPPVKGPPCTTSSSYFLQEGPQSTSVESLQIFIKACDQSVTGRRAGGGDGVKNRPQPPPPPHCTTSSPQLAVSKSKLSPSPECRLSQQYTRPGNRTCRRGFVPEPPRSHGMGGRLEHEISVCVCVSEIFTTHRK